MCIIVYGVLRNGETSKTQALFYSKLKLKAQVSKWYSHLVNNYNLRFKLLTECLNTRKRIMIKYTNPDCGCQGLPLIRAFT